MIKRRAAAAAVRPCGYEVSYPNGDRAAYVTAVYEARVIGGSAAPGNGELSELAWFTPGQLPGLQLSRFSRAPSFTPSAASDS
jgi:hypothetical protein